MKKTHKQCRGPCHRTLPYEDFPTYLHKNGRTYSKSRCRDCLAIQQSEWRDTHPGYFGDRDHYRHRATMLGLSKDVVEEYWKTHDGKCDICGRQASDVNSHFKHLSIDHDHGSMELRGFLCNPCNRALGLFGDDHVRLEAAACYLRERKGGDAILCRKLIFLILLLRRLKSCWVLRSGHSSTSDYLRDRMFSYFGDGTVFDYSLVPGPNPI